MIHLRPNRDMFIDVGEEGG